MVQRRASKGVEKGINNGTGQQENFIGSVSEKVAEKNAALKVGIGGTGGLADGHVVRIVSPLRSSACWARRCCSYF